MDDQHTLAIGGRLPLFEYLGLRDPSYQATRATTGACRTQERG